MLKIRRGDKVLIIAGKDKGKVGSVLKIMKNFKVIVEGVNFLKKNVKGNPQQNKKGEIITKEFPIHYSNIAIFNSFSNKKDKIRFKLLNNKKSGLRVFKSSGDLVSHV